MEHSANFPIHLHRNCENYSSLLKFSGHRVHLFRQKTSTLAQNIIEFQKCCVHGVAYGEEITEAQRRAVTHEDDGDTPHESNDQLFVPPECQRCNKHGGACVQEQTFPMRQTQAHLTQVLGRLEGAAMLNRECFLLSAIRHLDFMITKVVDYEFGT
ncbi:hypothetical protein BYT27DRAFT_6938623 [Phlegmacium glaucopus]|nr:hypothetical protein BYT27DRAFT_6938623 [Phlegmacium glaucopus]